ncbi:Ionotropic receptor 122 [Frankliniella occidentalis]|nr:Ionotropic receptor 122 [Frankliniella occidentalis]
MALLVHLGILIVVLCWAGARAALHPANTSAAPGAECVASLVFSILPPDDSCLIVHGDAQLVGPLLQELGGARQTLVTDPRNLYDRLRCELYATPKFAVVGMASAVQLSEFVAHIGGMAPMSGLVLWTRAPSLLAVLQHLRAARGMVWLCAMNFDLVVSAPDGTSLLGRLTGDECVAHLPSLGVQAIDRCTSGPGWQQRQWHKLCSEWQPPKKGPRLGVYAFKPKGTDSDSAPESQIVRQVTVALSRRQPFNVSWYESFRHIPDALGRCSVAVCFMDRAIPVIDYPHIRFAGFKITPVIAVVPAGAGLRLVPLRAVTAEFSAELWIATALALLFMTAAVAVAWTTLGRPPLAALAVAILQTVAPLLGQSPPGRTAHRPLSAVWLLMSVVLAAAYQGLLLRELTSPPPEISSLEEVFQSGMDVYADSILHVLDHIRHHKGKRNPQPVFLEQRDVPGALQIVADRRNSAVLCFANGYCNYIVSHEASGGRLHAFTVPRSHYITGEVVYSSKSPLTGPLKRVIGAVRGGGLTWHHEDVVTRRLRRTSSANHTAHAGRRTRPLSVGHMMPAYCLLSVGLTLGLLVFALEVLSDAWSRRHAPPVAVFLH